jgi:D-aminopeptidase
MGEAKKQLFIICDLEGASQISPDNRQAMHHGSELWAAQGRQFLTSDVKAVCEAANEFGIDEILINDEHDSGKKEPNVLIDQLPANVKVIKRPHILSTPRKMAPHPYGVIMVGEHARYGRGGFAPHSIQSPPIGSITLNGIEMGEIGLELAVFMDEKFLAIIGEEAAVVEAKELCPNVVGVPVKSLEKDWFPRAEDNYALIKANTAAALRLRDMAGSLHLDPPFKFTLTPTEEYCFNPKKKGTLPAVAAWWYHYFTRGKLDASQAAWQSKTVLEGLNYVHMLRLLMEKKPQATGKMVNLTLR